MQRKRRLVVIAKQREFDEDKWKRLLTAFAYVLHERRAEQQQRDDRINEADVETGDER